MRVFERLFVGKRIRDLGGFRTRFGEGRVLVVERRGVRRVVLRTSAPGNIQYTFLPTESVPQLQRLLAEALEIVGISPSD